MLPANSSGLTTQKIVLSLSSGSASRTVSIDTITLVKSGDTPMLFTVPMTTFLYLSCDWPAVRPAALSKAMVMVGPLLEKVSQASQRAIRAVTIGTIHTSGMRRRRCTPAVGSSTGPPVSVIVPSVCPCSVRKVTKIIRTASIAEGDREADQKIGGLFAQS